MKQMTEEEMERIINAHEEWIDEGCERGRGKANFADADLVLKSIKGRNLYYAKFNHSNLSHADLEESAFRRGDFKWANLYDANLRHTDLMNADFRNANLGDADLRGANLESAKFSGANLYGALLDDEEEIRKGIKLTSPMKGWKKCKDEYYNDVIVELEIPRGAIVFSINNSKCRTDKAKVIRIYGADRAYSTWKYFSYYEGDEIEVFDFDCQYNNECAKGIHFFRTREEAEDY